MICAFFERVAEAVPMKVDDLNWVSYGAAGGNDDEPVRGFSLRRY